MSSLSGRLLLFVSLLLIVFFGVTILALDGIFRNMSERSLRDLLDAQLIALIAASDADEAGGVSPSRPLGEPRFSQPGSGLYAQIRTEHGEQLWRSQSSLGADVQFGSPTIGAGQRVQQRIRIPRADRPPIELMVLSAALHWELQPGAERELVFSVATSLGPYEAQLHRFRAQLFSWFSGLMILLLVALALLLRQLLAPLRRIEREIGEVEAGARDQLGTEGLPSELIGLAGNTNTLLTSERKRVERYRNTLGNLAHSLKTPLAVIRNTLSARRADTALDEQINQQIDRMDTIVQHQLKRATASGGAVVGRVAIDVKPILTELRAALTKVYANKDLLIELDVADDASFAGERGDFFELAGNLLDNACKWCRSHVKVTAARQAEGAGRAQLHFTIEDDGKGIAAQDRQRILERGARVDEQVAGQGIGLSMVREIVEQYGGRLEIIPTRSRSRV